MTEELGAISVGLRVGLGTLDRDLAAIKKKIDPIAKDHTISFTVGRVNVGEIEREIKKISKGAPIPVPFTASANSGRLIHRELTAQLRGLGPIKVQVSANLSRTELNRFRREFETAMRRQAPLHVPVTGWYGGGGGAAPPSTGPVRPTGPRSAPSGPSVASGPAGRGGMWSPAAVDAFWSRQNAELDRAERRAMDARTRAERRRAAEEQRERDRIARSYTYAPAAPAPEPTPARRRRPRAARDPLAGISLGGVPTGPSTPVTYRTGPGGDVSVVDPTPGRGVRGRVQGAANRQQSRRVSTDELRAEKARPNVPETPEELEYASRPNQVRVPLSQEEADFASEGRGVRGASRSGARQRNEPVLTAADLLSRDIQRDDLDAATSATRDAEIRRPARRSAAYLGGTPRNPRFARVVGQLQLYRMDPRLGQALEALNSGELGEARALLTGFSSELAGADPRKRKRFFRLFRNTENAPPEVLEKHAALQGLFSEIAIQQAALQVENTEADIRAFGKPKGPKAGWPESVREKYDDLVGARKAARRWEQDVLRGVRRRAGGGRVEGPLHRRLRLAREARERYVVGETRPETYVGDDGSVEIIGQNGPEIRSFPQDGQVLPYVPEWVRRMDKNAKDFTRRAPGGRVYAGPLAAEPRSGLGPPWKRVRDAFEGERAAIAAGQLSSQGNVQRVFVTNWPAGGSFMSMPGGASRAAGPRRGGSTADPLEEIRDLLRGTATVSPKEEKTDTVRPTPLTAEERATATLEARFGGEPREFRRRAAERSAFLSETTAQSPVRSLAPAVGQIVGTLFGRGELLRRLAEAREKSGLADAALNKYNASVQKTAETEVQYNAAVDPELRAKLKEQLDDQAGATEKYKTELVKLNKEADAAAKNADAFSLKLGTLVGNTAGIIGGTLLFGATLGIAQAGLGAIAQVLSPVIERMSGYQNVTAKVTSNLADQTRQQGGATQTAVAAAQAQVGLSKSISDTISPLLEQRAETEAGNKALQEGLDLFHAFEAVRKQNAGRGGFDQGLTRTTGGFFGTILNGIPSTSELIGNALRDVPAEPRDNAAIEKLQQERAAIEAKGESPLDLLFGPSKNQQLATINSQIKALGGEIDQTPERLKFFNDAIQKGGEQFRFMAQSSLPDLTDAQREAAAAAADAVGAFDIANNVRDLKTILTDAAGRPVTDPEQVTRALTAINKSFTTPDPQVLIKQLTERLIPAARDLFAAQGRFQRGVINPGQFALGELANPSPGTQGIPFGAGLVGKGDTDARRAASAYRREVGGAVDYVNSQIDAGRQALIDLVPANLRGEFTNILGDIEQTGQQISKIQLGVQQSQVNLAVAEYNNQLRIARRSLQDAKDLQAGIRGETRNTLGGIEGQNIAIQRQLQLLGFELQQRQINFKLATAGFVAPGTTPEERAARIEAAKLEAAFAQKQLDLQKQLAANQFRGVQISADRSVTDLIAQIGLLEQGRSVTINTAAAARALDVLNKKQQLLVQQAGTYIEEGVKITQAAMEATSEIQKQTGKGFAYILSQTARAWGIFGGQAEQVLQALMGTAPKRPSQGNGPTSQSGYASGIVGDTLGPTQITVGEAAGEKVAVLKNPKIVPTSALGMGYGGGGGAPVVQMTVIVTGNSVREEMDLKELADLMADSVERRLQQKTSLFGLRRA